jgi:ubiquinone biosynthesis protein COQ9
MDKQKAAEEILAQALALVPFEGWTQAVLNQAATRAGYKKTDAIRVFPGGAIEAIDTFIAKADRDMLEAFSQYHLDTMKIRERIATLVRLQLTALTPHRESVRKAVALQALPFYCHRALKNLYRTVDAIWYACSDQSTDFNFYTKRLLLGGVYSATLLYWLDDKTPGSEFTWQFLDRRIADVMKIEKAKAQLGRWFERKSA